MKLKLTLNIIAFVILFGGWLSGKIFSKLKLPNILGMLLCGILLGVYFKNAIPQTIWDIEPILKSLALIIIILRAGLSIKKDNLAQIGNTAITMSILPCLIEGAALIFIFRFFFQFEWISAGMAAFIISAVSPAVVVPAMIEIKEKNPSENKVPTLMLASASVDNVAAITIFSLFLNIHQSKSIDITKILLTIPLSILSGIGFGVILGFALVVYFEKKYKQVRASEKTLIILMLALLLLQIGDWLHSAALLSIITVGFIILEKTEYIAQELSQKLQKLWIPAEIILFVYIGMKVDLKIIISAGVKGLIAIIIGLFFRALAVFLSTAFSNFTIKERIFCMIAYLPKATVQAALAGIPLALGIKEGNIILAVAVLSILFTTPIGVFGIKYFGNKFLKLNF